MVKGTEFVVFKNALENGGSVRAINAKGCGSFPRKQIDSLVEFVKTYQAKGLAWIVVNADGTLKSQIAKFFSPEKLQEIVDTMEGKAGDLILICADKDKVVFDSLGALRVELSKRLEFCLFMGNRIPNARMGRRRKQICCCTPPIYSSYGRRFRTT